MAVADARIGLIGLAGVCLAVQGLEGEDEERVSAVVFAGRRSGRLTGGVMVSAECCVSN